ncbi:MAG: hypothetical protein ACYTBJ_19455 [Planctomycetota bacterium]|jgi:hypothetical protein
MNGKPVTLFHIFVVFMISSGLVWAAETKKVQTSDHYLKIVRSYADVMLEHGRDKYGPVQSPLFAAALDRKNMKLVGKVSKIKGIRKGDRILKGANPMHDMDLYQVLYSLAEVTGEKRYAEEADKALQWFFEHCQSPVTGLMAWGEHIGWEFDHEGAGPVYKIKGENRFAPHEFFGPWVFWEKSFMLAPPSCVTFARGLWDHQIHEHSGSFSRHARWDEHNTHSGHEFPRHGGFYIETWARAYQHTKDPIFLKAIGTLVDYFNSNSSEKSGAIPCSSCDWVNKGKRWRLYIDGRLYNRKEDPLEQSPILTADDTAETAPIRAGLLDKKPFRINIMWPQSNLSLAIDLWDAAGKVPQALSGKMKARASKCDKVFLGLKHDFAPNGKGFVAGANVHTLERLPEGSKWVGTQVWATGYGKCTDAQVAMMCYLRYRQVGNEGFKKLTVDSAARYLTSSPDLAVTLYPGSIADAILHMLAAYELTGQQKYIERADYFGLQAVEIFIDNDLPLPRASSEHDHYETITGGDDLMMALLRLWVAKERPHAKLSWRYNNR